MKKALIAASIILICSIFLISFASFAGGASPCDDARIDSIDPDSSCRVVEGGTIWLRRNYCAWKDDYINYKGRCFNDENGVTYDYCFSDYAVAEAYIRGCSGCTDYSKYMVMGCGLRDCDSLDTTCRNYYDVQRKCSNGACYDPPCDSYVNRNEGVLCGPTAVCHNGECGPCTGTYSVIVVGTDSRLLCYNNTFYQCGTGAYELAKRMKPCNKVSSYYCHPDGYWTSASTEGLSCGYCYKCQNLTCKYLCVPCQWCSTGEVCEWLGAGASDTRCGDNGSIDCGGWYSKSGRKGPDDDDIEQCWSYANITSEQCKTQGCKEANSSDCSTWSYTFNLEYNCSECKYIQNGDCFNNILGSCTNYIVNTPCRKGAYYGTCDGAGTCNIVTKCADGTAVGNCSVTKPQYCDVYGELYDDCSTCGCPDGFDCAFSGHCININLDCSTILSQTECNNNAPTCFWNGAGCSFCANVTACGSYTLYGKNVCEADMCGLTRASSNCSWNGASCYEYFFIEDCFNSIDDDGDWVADCDDPDCSSSAYCSGAVTCGDGVINSGEECDTDIFPYGWDSCTDFGYGGGNLSCYPQGSAGQCKFDFSDCTDPLTTPNCSNSIINSRESCDGTELGGMTCESLGFFSGDLGCINCHFDTWHCVGAVTKESNPEACNDTVDNDNDDYIDYMDKDCQSTVKPNPEITRQGGDCAPGDKTATAILTYTYHLRFGLEDKIVTKDVTITCPIPLSARLPFFSLISFLITLILLFVYYFLGKKKTIKA